MSDLANSETIVVCEACGGEGRILIVMPGESDPEDHGPCDYCQGTGREVIKTQPIDIEDRDALDSDAEA
jgi:DnaJ-class molecular chaperone